METSKQPLEGVVETPPVEIQRNAKGYFAKGNTLAWRDKGKNKRYRLLEAFERVATQKDIREIYRAMLEKAIKGDVRAASFIFERLFGKPIQETVKDVNITSMAATFANTIPLDASVDRKKLIEGIIAERAKGGSAK